MSPLQTLIDAGLTLRSDGERLIVTPASALTEPLRELIRERKPELLEGIRRADVLTAEAERFSHACALPGHQSTTERTQRDADRWCWPHSEAMNTAELAALAARRDRLMRWGWSADDAEALADRLTLNARDTHDDRRSCADCRHGRLHRCPDGAPLPADLLHRCGGFGEHTQ